MEERNSQFYTHVSYHLIILFSPRFSSKRTINSLLDKDKGRFAYTVNKTQMVAGVLKKNRREKFRESKKEKSR
jgi:hypothetical protein